MRENRTQGSARGLSGNGQSYLDGIDLLYRAQDEIAMALVVAVQAFLQRRQGPYGGGPQIRQSEYRP
ncbi:MAG: hypothetical protein ACI9VS_001951 [Candidatus Binatia bacterium]